MNGVEVDIGQNARDVVSRLSNVELASARLDSARVEAALSEFLRRLKLPPRPVRWARDYTEVAGLYGSLKDSRRSADLFAAIGKSAKRPGKVSKHTAAYDAAWKAAGAVIPRAWTDLLEAVIRVQTSHWDGSVEWEYRQVYEPIWAAARASYGDARWAACEFARMHGTEHDGEASREFAALKLPLLDAYEAGLWLYWVATEEILALPRPSIRLRDGRLHGDGVPAVAWESGERLHFLNGVLVPEELALTPARELDARLVLSTRNAEVRREVVRKLGLERVVTELGAVCADREGDYELLLLDLGDRRRRPFLKMRNPSVPGVFHIEGVHPKCRTVREALAWRNGTDAPPSVLT
jgi:hypothetical protein